MVGDLFLRPLASPNVRRGRRDCIESTTQSIGWLIQGIDFDDFVCLSKDAEPSHWLVLIFAARCRTLMQAAWQSVD
jgi:hypothetical protein